MRHLLLFCLIYGSLSCATNSDTLVTVPPDPRRDGSYHPIYEKNTRYREVIHQFETRFTIHVTRLGPEFRSALAERYQKVFNEPQPVLGEVTANTGFFVSIFIPDVNFRDLGNESLWNIQLKSNGETSKPALIQRLEPKEKWTPFFPGINQWTLEYLILFDQAPSSSDGTHELLRTVSSELIISSILGRVVLKW